MLGFPTAAGGRRRLVRKFETWPSRSCGCGSDPGPLSSPPEPEAASARCFVLYHTVASRLSKAVGRRRKTAMPTRGVWSDAQDSALSNHGLRVSLTPLHREEKIGKVRWLGSKLLASSR